MAGDADEDGGGGASANERRVERFVKWLGWAAKILAFPGLVVAAFVGFKSWGAPDIRARLTTCHPYQIVLETRNQGGRTATLGTPRFGIHSSLRHTELFMPRLVEELPRPRGVVGTGPAVDQPFNSTDQFFSRPESEGNSCWIFVRVPVAPDRGPLSAAWSSCRCEYSN